ncbi:hypothetical protein [Ancylobacter sp.]|uniref:hypothetical protein n=1 Tax=Ancylobacter sp. TaxID=1872567 RepID=UPI003BAC0A7F
MGYNLMIFEPSVAPKEAAPFLAWYAQQTDWNDTDDYDDYEATTPRLRAFFLDMVATHPPINGPLAADALDDSDIRLTDYSIGRDIIYLGGSWETADTALALALQLAEKHGLGVFDTTSDVVWLPAKGKMAPAFETAPAQGERPPALLDRAIAAVARWIKRGR